MKRARKFPPIVEFTIKVRTSLGDDLSPRLQGLKEAMNANLCNYRDGRYWFAVEMIREGIERSIRSARESVVRTECQKKFKNKMVKTKHGSMSLSLSEANKIIQKLETVSIWGDGVRCTEVRIAEDEWT